MTARARAHTVTFRREDRHSSSGIGEDKEKGLPSPPQPRREFERLSRACKRARDGFIVDFDNQVFLNLNANLSSACIISTVGQGRERERERDERPSGGLINFAEHSRHTII